MSETERDRFRSRIGAAIGLPADNVALFARGRVALYAILRSIGIGPGDEVILPAFTCVAVPNAILYTGARPVWVDIDASTLCIDPAAVERAIGRRTRAILAQNTFGLSADLDALTRIAEPHGLVVIDDAAHGLGGRYRGRPNGATAPLSFFSTQWSKPISTGLGGVAVDRDGTVADRLRSLELAAEEPSALRVTALRALIAGRTLAGSGRILQAGRTAYRFVSRRNVVPGSSGQEELEGTDMPAGFLARMSEVQAAIGSERLPGLAGQVDRRRAIARRYGDVLALEGRTAAAEPPYAEHAFLRYPLRVSDRPLFRDAAARAGIDLGDWFVSPVHPVVDQLGRWGYNPGAAPVAERACAEIVNLPTEASMPERSVDRVVAFLADHLDLIA